MVAKLSASCDRSVTSLAMEAIAATLAGDLALPVPQPYIVSLAPEWIETINDAEWLATARRSAAVAFGSRTVGAGYSDWIVGMVLGGAVTQTAAEIFVFDALIDNPDRRDGNANCLVRGDEIRIIDHELAFPDNSMIIGWRPPWSIGGLHHLETPGAHIFRRVLKGSDVDWDVIKGKWQSLSDGKLADYGGVIPPEWAGATPAVASAVTTIKNARDHIDECITEIRRVLT